MIKYLKYICLALIGFPLFLLALANNHTVNLYLFPESIAAFLGLDAFISMPLFIALLLGGLIGLLVGFIWQGLRGAIGAASRTIATTRANPCETRS